MWNIANPIDIGTSSFFCEWCGEVTYGTKMEIVEGFESIDDSIEYICEDCVKGYKQNVYL